MEHVTAFESAVRPYVQQVSKLLPQPIRSLGESLVGPSCYEALLDKFTVIERSECIKIAISKALGLAIVSSSGIVKVPQLIKLLKSRSAEGLSFVGYALETISFAMSCAYNVRRAFPFSTWGEMALIGIQNVIICTLILAFSERARSAQVWLSFVVVAISVLFSKNAISDQQFSIAQVVAGVLGAASKIPQIWTVHCNRSTGQISAIVVFMYLVGSSSRIFTTIQEVSDPVILAGFVAGFVLNVILAGQMIYYWNPKPKKH